METTFTKQLKYVQIVCCEYAEKKFKYACNDSKIYEDEGEEGEGLTKIGWMG